ncbi:MULTISPECIES: MOSC domain-containing protein [Aneurinibacillus]|uniref:MOSC domain-containing protein n=1 Tax=Aneurinibacillus thermoaerophilus TaxID=143495 RepID=A0A1G8ATS2_ANETH|nr:MULTISPECIES: MOSC domain-containing protein [Aneurinibacillus]AMA72852.1 cytoplasmic protein [Aneurinibacillus sp. XH2]MED0677045.1 MOSC domain-containing protein [Aneurinibacillus thermoaerophilus]MED0680065.1 MOSC domain-containing protein [Aneurinibacillus thermoaerophilus]MED0738177.1 MOSC domain-containing protein [Aneurinibacillus thermoaerophilus]MED0758205.1 MOSC domain-containing protein [Aneurinibacillus thermoaerophilus]
MPFEILSINVGKPKNVFCDGMEITTGIYKKPVTTEVFLSTLNFTGDGQADLVHHGGVDKAVCVYPYEHYPYWETQLGQMLEFAAFGENLTVKGMTEEKVHIGDIFQLGEAVVQISQPRQPCYKLAKRYNIVDLPLKVQQTGFTGFYFRVLQKGWVNPASTIQLLERHPAGITVAFANQIMHHDKKNKEAIRKLLEIDELSASWKKTLQKRLKGADTDPRKRLTGES